MIIHGFGTLQKLFDAGILYPIGAGVISRPENFNFKEIILWVPGILLLLLLWCLHF